MAHGGARLERSAPALGAHTEEVLAAVGYSAEQIAAFREAKVI
jgi:crotonobetainyl-CoA:carnitine CoA-transferase CaiB-like acyl-CoA transferase